MNINFDLKNLNKDFLKFSYNLLVFREILQKKNF